MAKNKLNGKVLEKKISDMESAEQHIAEYADYQKEISYLKDKMTEIKEKIEDLCKKNPDWFVNANGTSLKVVRIGEGKVSYKKMPVKFKFAKESLEIITKFLKEHPASIKFELRKMDNVPLEKYNISKTEGKTTFTIEVEL